MANVREATEQAKGAVADLRGENGPVQGASTGDLQQTLALGTDAMADLAETTEALKRNFFFRGFFNRRGYFDLDDVSVQAVPAGRARDEGSPRAAHLARRRACSSSRTRTARNGSARTGAARLDSAMSQFVQLPAERARSSSKATRTEATADVRFLLQPDAGAARP